MYKNKVIIVFFSLCLAKLACASSDDLHYGRPNLPERLSLPLNGFIPIYSDICSLELQGSKIGIFSSPKIRSSKALLSPLRNSILSSLDQLQEINGGFEKSLALQGSPISSWVVEGLEEGRSHKFATNAHHILVSIDRQVDLLTPLMHSQLYASLLSEIYDPYAISSRLQEEIFQNIPLEKATAGEFASEEDVIFLQLRDLEFHQAIDSINECTLELRTMRAKIDEYKSEMETLRKVPSLIKEFLSRKHFIEMHLSVIEDLGTRLTSTDYSGPSYVDLLGIENKILTNNITLDDLCRDFFKSRDDQHLDQLLRIVCLKNLHDGGFEEEEWRRFTTDLVHFYGIKILSTIRHFQRLGLLKIKKKKRNLFSRVIKREDSPEFKAASERLESTLDKLPKFSDARPLKVFVLFIGGVSYHEIEKLRAYTKRHPSKEIIILTTRYIRSGQDFIKEIREQKF